MIYKDVLANCHERLGKIYNNHWQESEKAITHLKEAEKLWKDLTKEAPGFAEYKKSLDRIQKELA